MKWLNEKDAEAVKKELDVLKNNIKILFFTQEIECSFCRETHEVLTELSDLSEKVSLEVFNFVRDEEKVKHYRIDKIPATVITDERGKDFGIRFYGIPAGYEFVSLLHALKMVGNAEHGLNEESVKAIATLTKPVHLQVFVTPTCPYCPMAVQVGHALAYLSEHITADMVEASEYPHLANKYNVMGVPKVIINETGDFEGSLPEALYIAEVLKAVEEKSNDNQKDQL